MRLESEREDDTRNTSDSQMLGCDYHKINIVNIGAILEYHIMQRTFTSVTCDPFGMGGNSFSSSVADLISAVISDSIEAESRYTDVIYST